MCHVVLAWLSLVVSRLGMWLLGLLCTVLYWTVHCIHQVGIALGPCLAQVFSRLGTWVYDVVDAQIFQTAVPSAEANLVGTTEMALASLAELFMLGVAIISRRPFQALVIWRFFRCPRWSRPAAAIYIAWLATPDPRRAASLPAPPLRQGLERHSKPALDKEEMRLGSTMQFCTTSAILSSAITVLILDYSTVLYMYELTRLCNFAQYCQFCTVCVLYLNAGPSTPAALVHFAVEMERRMGGTFCQKESSVWASLELRRPRSWNLHQEGTQRRTVRA